MARTAIASDDFNRAAPLGSNWAQTNSFEGAMTISAGNTAARGGNAQPVGIHQQSAVWAGSGSFTGSQYSSIVLGTLQSGTSSYNIGATVMDDGDDNNCSHYGISLAIDSSSSPYTVTLFKMVDQTYTSLNSGSLAFASGDELSIEYDPTADIVYGCKNGVRMGGAWTVSDATLSTGKPGICGASDVSIQALATSWEGGNVTASAAAAATRKLLLGVGA